MKVLTRVALALSVLAGIAASPAAAATREVVVTVVDAAGKPVAGAEVVVAAERESVAQTDEQGQVTIETTAATVEVTVTARDGASGSVKSNADAINVALKGRS
jgi:outer membrane usher protein FimD/PapC